MSLLGAVARTAWVEVNGLAAGSVSSTALTVPGPPAALAGRPLTHAAHAPLSSRVGDGNHSGAPLIPITVPRGVPTRDFAPITRIVSWLPASSLAEAELSTGCSCPPR